VSRERIEVVRQPLVLRSTARRTLEERLVRFPRLVRFLARVVWRVWVLLPPGAWARRAIVRHYITGVFEALNRRDLEVALALYHPDGESLFDRRMVSLGIEPRYLGQRARFEMQRKWNADWGDWRFEPDELIDLGDERLLITGELKGTGLTSGIVVGQPSAFLLTMSRGLAIREQVFLDQAEAYQAAGLSK
jgi:ketosteroid isomerase-like protein